MGRRSRGADGAFDRLRSATNSLTVCAIPRSPKNPALQRCSRVPNRPLRPRRGRIGHLELLLSGIIARTAVRFLGQVYDVRGTALHCWTVLETFVHPLDRMKGHAQLWHTRVVLAIVPRTAKLLGWISQNVAPMNFPKGHESIPMHTGVGATTPPRAARSGWVAPANSRAHPFYSSSSQSRRRLCGGHTARNKSER